MKLNISKSNLAEALPEVLKVIASRSSIPILAGILIVAQKDTVEFFGTDLETSICVRCAGLVEEEGRVVVPGKIFNDIVRSLPESSVLLETEDEMLSIRSQQAHFIIRTLNTDEFAHFPEIEGTQSIVLPASTIKDMVNKVSKVVSRDETRAVLTAILVIIEENTIKMVATDGYRLAMSEQQTEAKTSEKFEILVPGKVFNDVVNMVLPKENIEITLTTNQIQFSCENITLVTRRIEGNYPNYRQLIPTEFNTSVILVREEMIAAVKRAALLAFNNAALKMTVSVEDSALTIAASAQDYGQAEENVMVKIEGDDNFIAVNPNYLLDGLSVMSSEFITLEIVESMKPGVMTSEEENFTYLFMPVRST
ncbi:MAG: DNA polymerase III subunit beta [Coriobacteriia bacterium]|nr:DNA polymerase III subunit beta [Coriobacteriia bacterium]